MGGGALHQILGRRVQHIMKKYTQSDLQFSKNDGSQKSKEQWKKGSLGSKIKKKIGMNYFKIVN